VLRDPSYTDTGRALIWNFPNNWGKGLEGQGHSFVSAVRQGNWKLIYFEKGKKLELYNLKKDIKEQHDVSEKYSRKTKYMARLLTKKLKKAKAQMPTVKATGEKVPWPTKVLK